MKKPATTILRSLNQGPQRNPSVCLSRHPVSLAEACEREAERFAARLDWAAQNSPLPEAAANQRNTQVNCYTIIETELKKGPRTESKLIEKCEAEGFAARGAKVALTRGTNAGRFQKTESGSYAAA